MIKYLRMEDLFEPSKIKKKILIDSTFLFDQYSTRGIGRYGIEIVSRIIEIVYSKFTNYEIGLIGFLDLESNLAKLGLSLNNKYLLHRVNFFSLGEIRLSTPRNIFDWLSKYVPIINAYKPDLYFTINFERGYPTVPIINKKLIVKPKTIVTIHDIIPVMVKKYSSKGAVHNYMKGIFYNFMLKGISKVDLIITPSEYTKKQILKYKKIKEEKINCVYNGISDKFFISKYQLDPNYIKNTLEKYKLLGEKYLFYDSGLEPSKGINELLMIFKSILSVKSITLPKKLVITGKSLNKGMGLDISSNDVLGDRFLNYAKKLNILENICATGYITDDELLALLINATAHIYLSKNEGFGFGPIQAMAAEVPTIVYNGSCLPEITQGGALLVNLKDLSVSARQIINFLEDENLILEMKQKGLEVAQRYNWDNTAISTWQLIQNLLE